MEALQTLAVRYASRFPADAAHRLDTVPAADAGFFLAELDPQTAAVVIDGMAPSSAAAAFETMEPDKLARILERMPVARCVRVLRSVDKDERAAIIGLLPRKTAPWVERLLRSSKDSAGFLAEPARAVLSPEMSVAEARQLVGGISSSAVYVVDGDHRLVGVIHHRQLAESDPRARIGNLMSANVIRIPSAAPLSAILNHQAWFDFDQLPVVDDAGVLVGVVRHRSIRQTEKTYRAAPLSPLPGLATFLDLGELYWGGLTSVVSAMAGRPAAERSTEFNHDR